MSQETPLLPLLCFAQPPEGRQIAALRGTPIAQAQRGRRLPGSHRLHGRPITFSIRRWYVFQRPLLEAALDLRAHYDACAGTDTLVAL